MLTSKRVPSEVCTHPVPLMVGKFRYHRPCNLCVQCRARRKQAWVGRMRLELAEVFGLGRFLTLTYASDPGELAVSDLQSFLKRHRHHEGPFRYFAVGEYGDVSGRGHWHVMIFGQPQAHQGFSKLAAWTDGHVYEGNITPQSIGYVAGYTMKLLTKLDRKPITVMSRRPGIGVNSIVALGATYFRQMNVADGKKSHVLPSRYQLGTQSYPLLDGGAVAFRRGYELAGGAPKQSPLHATTDLVYEVQRREQIWDHMGVHRAEQENRPRGTL